MAELESTEDQKAPANSSRIIFLLVAVLIVIAVCGVWAFNYVSVDKPLQGVLTKDSRNQVLTARAHFDDWVDTSTIVFDVTGISANATRMDVFRALLQYAEAMKDRHLTKLILAARRTGKFTLDGSYFQDLGKEFRTQNPMYTIRKFPTHLVAMDGSK